MKDVNTFPDTKRQKESLLKQMGKGEITYHSFTMDDFTDMCWDCGIKKYPEARDMGSIGIGLRRCPECRKMKGVIPGRDWAYRAGMFEKYT